MQARSDRFNTARHKSVGRNTSSSKTITEVNRVQSPQRCSGHCIYHHRETGHAHKTSKRGMSPQNRCQESGVGRKGDCVSRKTLYCSGSDLGYTQRSIYEYYCCSRQSHVDSCFIDCLIYPCTKLARSRCSTTQPCTREGSSRAYSTIKSSALQSMASIIIHTRPIMQNL